MKETLFKKEREQLLNILKRQGIRDERVLKAIGSVPRHLFMERALWPNAYENTPLPIGVGQTISQPYIVASMTEAVCGGKQLHSVLEIGTGSGYQTAVLAKVVETVYSIERIRSLADLAEERLVSLGVSNVHLSYGDGYQGWLEFAPFDGILVTAAPTEIPKALLAQLSENGGRMVIPVGKLGNQELILVVREGNEYKMGDLGGVRFVPLVPGVE